MLKHTDMLLELTTYIEMYDMIRYNIRGGLCTTGSIRYAEANNPYMREEYNPNKANSYTIPFDANIFMDMLCLNHYQVVNMNGSIQEI